MTSAIDITKPDYGNPTTQSVRDNFTTAKAEIEELQGAFAIGPFLPLSGGTMTGPLNYTATGGSALRSAQDRAADVANILDFIGADPTGRGDSTAAIQRAIATGKNVQLSAGSFRVTSRFYLGSLTKSQSLTGDALGTTLIIDGSFDPTVNDGVIVLTGINLTDQRPAITNITFKFEQPADLVTTTTAASVAGTNTITVASVVGIIAGMAVYDVTAAGIPSVIGGTSSLPCTVSSIAGNVVTLSQNIIAPGVGNGDSIHFAPVRSMFQTLANGGTTTPGGTGVQYPWAIYCAGNVQAPLIDNVMIVGAWNGIYIRGSSFGLGRVKVNAFNVGLDCDNCLNFASVADYSFWCWGYGPADPYGQARQALLNVFYDGVTIAANFGRCDGLTAESVSSWAGIVNLTANWTFGQFTNLRTDGNNADLVIAPTGTGWVQIGNWYSTKGSRTIGTALVMNPTNATFTAIIDNVYLTSSSALGRGILQQGGRLSLNGGAIWHGLQAVRTMIQATAGILRLAGLQLDASTARTDTYVGVSGTAAIQMVECTFVAAPGSGGVGVSLASDNALHLLSGNVWNGWTQSLPAAALGANAAGNYGNLVRPVTDPTSVQSGSFSFTGLPAANHNATAFGMRALLALTTGTNNTAIGYQAGQAVTASGSNTFVGENAGLSTDASNNTAVGSGALQANAAGTNNVAVGSGALVAANTNANTAVGYQAGASVTTGGGNTIIGRQVGSTVLQTGTTNILIGVSNAVTVPSDTSNFFGLGGTGGVTFSATAMNSATPAWSFLGTVTIPQINVGVAAGPNLRSGAGVPSTTQPAGSLFLRTDGAIGSRLYVSAGGGTWAAVAGV